MIMFGDAQTIRRAVPLDTVTSAPVRAIPPRTDSFESAATFTQTRRADQMRGLKKLLGAKTVSRLAPSQIPL